MLLIFCEKQISGSKKINKGVGGLGLEPIGSSKKKWVGGLGRGLQEAQKKILKCIYSLVYFLAHMSLYIT